MLPQRVNSSPSMMNSGGLAASLTLLPFAFTMFAKFAETLDKAHRQIQTADRTLEEIVGARTKAINRRLRGVEELNGEGAVPLIDEE